LADFDSIIGDKIRKKKVTS